MRFKTHQLPMVAVIVLATTCLLLTGGLCAQSPDSVSESGVAVLRNGQTMAGEISRHDGKVVLRLESGSRIYLPQERVLFTAATLSEAYWELAARTKPTDIEGQVGVFQWCLRNELFEEGANHLLVLQESKIPARRLSALDLDLQAKKKRAEFRNTQAVEHARRKQQLAKREIEEEARKERIETLIGDKTRVTIPDLHHVPRRPIRSLKQSVAGAAVIAKQPRAVGKTALTEVIDQFGNPAASDPKLVDPVSDMKVRQVSYEQPIFSSPAVAASKKTDAQLDSKPQPAEPLADLDEVRKISRPTKQAQSSASGFSATTKGGTGAPAEEAESMADPFDANYFNRRFASPPVDEK